MEKRNQTVEPLREIKDIRKVKRRLKDNPRNLLLFTMGINNGLRISDLLSIKVDDVKDLEIGETFQIREGKTGKKNVLMVNGEVRKILDQYLNEVKPKDENYLFQSRKGKNSPISREYVNQSMKLWTKGIKGNFGTHTMRKTFGYIQRTQFGVGWEVLCKRFGHSSPSITMRYLGIEDKEVNGILLNEI